MSINLRHIGIVTNNLENSLKFYKDILGFKIKMEGFEDRNFIDHILNLKKSSLMTVKLVDEKGGIIELLKYDNPRGKPIKREINDLGLSHFALTVDDLNETYDRLKNNNIEFVSAPILSPDNKAKVCFCYDPNGIVIELVEQI
ncbi:TPA: hypothetical protein DEW47_00085 [Patescibacteria group bacterium]|nr:MAG: Lactoylglutathione lyase-like protein lyase [Parcubacteria group bacterium GW2011_GWF2_40_10]KKR58907.1 MAG: Lactoylglutathione lyase-like protein lyase [Parcubacteria group bacterium GW2011_GWC2_40_31]KKR75412.1 MAG: Lactoylglutathione lyase-like protein lyase [Parcubacteria group bacterium GW2011_GWB2_40_8]KKR76079.1 MAG: Lactoylglutathione lyase-like protein lyase [Parcubacteria group bacterium GW2011_GWE2_40_8]KKR81065.1 MAG: Lactoylglutathione lyase-like protein lyase [Parcubacteri